MTELTSLAHIQWTWVRSLKSFSEMNNKGTDAGLIDVRT